MLLPYYYLDADGTTARGPFPKEDMWSLRKQGILNDETLVCYEGYDKWAAYNSYPELRNPSLGAKKPSGVRVDYIAALVLAVIFGLFMLIKASNDSQIFDRRASGQVDKPSAAFEDTFQQASKVGRNFRVGNSPKPKWETLDEEARSRYPGDEERQKAWRSGWANGYDSY